MFCPKCKTMLKRAGNEWKCPSCDKACATSAPAEKIMMRSDGKEMAVMEELSGTLPKARVECTSCGHNEAYCVIRQTRAADEPETRIYRCVKCSHTWREY